MKKLPTLSIGIMKSITKYEMARIAENLFRRVEASKCREYLTIIYRSYEDMPDRLTLKTPYSVCSIIEGDDYNKSLNAVQQISLYLYDIIQKGNTNKYYGKRKHGDKII